MLEREERSVELEKVILMAGDFEMTDTVQKGQVRNLL